MCLKYHGLRYSLASSMTNKNIYNFLVQVCPILTYHYQLLPSPWPWWRLVFSLNRWSQTRCCAVATDSSGIDMWIDQTGHWRPGWVSTADLNHHHVHVKVMRRKIWTCSWEAMIRIICKLLPWNITLSLKKRWLNDCFLFEMVPFRGHLNFWRGP